eukprot:CAMPEP_0116034964 /NCGR_PEP_ID=MMETSP0321-20121206/20013_1 /TAXON_ID=163516 /ORGANISM="Leptocylindrus danicus var. danicus, Strain B650" /LENGTH=171 /DNA_ID=CAMNT_0003511561 /DNA_START=87 /DNA_END=602 /DNA_ORIENTATION=-
MFATRLHIEIARPGDDLSSAAADDEPTSPATGKKVYADGGDEYGFHEPNPYADQYVPEEEPTIVTEEMEAVMEKLKGSYESITSETGYVEAARKRAEDYKKQKAEAEARGENMEDYEPEPYKSPILMSKGAERQASPKKEGVGGVKEAGRSENSDILFVADGDDDDSLLVF